MKAKLVNIITVILIALILAPVAQAGDQIVSGKVMQKITGDGKTLEDGLLLDVIDVTGANRRAVVFLIGYPKYADAVDGDLVNVKGTPAGTFSYTTTEGATATVRKLKFTYGAQTTAPDTKRLIQAALTDFDAKNYDAALAKLEAVDSETPDDAFVQNLLGAAYTKKKDYATAQKYFEKSLEKKPEFFPAKFNMGELLFLQRKYEEALAYFEKMREKDPQNELLAFKIFLCQLQLGDKDKAAKALKNIKYQGDTPAWYYGQAAWASKEGDNKKALEYVTDAQHMFGPKTAMFDETFNDLGIKLR